jgi:putative flippase GtrA
MKFTNYKLITSIFLKRFKQQFFKYFLVSLICLAIDFSCYLFLFYVLNIYLDISATIGYVVGLIISYFLLTKYVFNSISKKSLKFQLRRIFLFLISGTVGAISTYSVVNIVVVIFGNDIYLAKAMAAVSSFIIVFLFRKFLKKGIFSY